jgi:hypothetical protein
VNDAPDPWDYFQTILFAFVLGLFAGLFVSLALA